jgi:IS5 family transposase
MDWKAVDERLIRRGELILDLESLRNHEKELEEMNKGRPGPRYKLANTYIQLLAIVRYLFRMPYRQLEGYTRALHRLVPELPEADYSGIMKRIQRLPVDPYKHLSESSDPVTIALDSTGVKVEKAGGWIERKHGKKKRYVKLHFAVRVDTHEVVSMEVTTDDVHDSKEAAGLLEGAERRANVEEALFDGAYDSAVVYRELERRGIEAVIKPRRNARSDTGPAARGVAVGQVRELGYGTWAEFTGYGRRWAVETAYSTFKRLFGECAMGRSLGSIAVELASKVALYNMLVNM